MMESNVSESTVNIIAEDSTEEAQVAQTPASEDEPVITYTEEEVASKISKAVNAALEKARKNSQKTSEDLANELAELKSELARKENEAYVSSETNSRGILQN